MFNLMIESQKNYLLIMVFLKDLYVDVYIVHIIVYTTVHYVRTVFNIHWMLYAV